MTTARPLSPAYDHSRQPTPFPFSAFPISSKITGSSIVAGIVHISWSAIFFIVPRRIFPDRVFGSRATTTACLATASGFAEGLPISSISAPANSGAQNIERRSKGFIADKTEFRAALLTGARYGELVRMTVGNFNEATAQLYVAPSKSGKARHIPLNASGVDLFKALTIGRAASAAMFARADGEAWGKNHQQRPLAEACKRAKISPSLRFHEARHSYASALAQAGADLLTISKLLGHADTRITSRHYAHLCDRTLANAVNNLLPSFGETEPTNVAAIR